MTIERKICLPLYKFAYSITFIVLVSLIRGITSVDEIGGALLPNVSLLAIVLMADTYELERREKRREIFYLFPQRLKAKTVVKRILIQLMYVQGLSVAGYGLFYWKKLDSYEGDSQIILFTVFLINLIPISAFWGMLSMTFVNVFQNLWEGVGCAVLLWLTAFSNFGDRIFGAFNIFAFIFHKEDGVSGWSGGMFLAAAAAILMVLAVPYIIRKRG